MESPKFETLKQIPNIEHQASNIYRYFIELAYKGTVFHGWQKQPNANSVQEELEKAMAVILRKPIEIVGSSRTDAGVHARQQFAHFDMEVELENLPIIAYKLNSVLPKGIAVRNIYAVSADAHSRFDAISRTYQYRIIQEKNPFSPDLCWYFRPALNIEAMNEAAYRMRKNYTDFQCFSKYHTDVKTFDCQIDFAVWEQKDALLTFDIRANRFLRGMVRAIVGTMLEIGQGRLDWQGLQTIIESKDRQNAKTAAPAQGLTLMEVRYPQGYFGGHTSINSV